MSKILTGLTESTNRKYDNNRTGFSRGPRDDERHDLDVQKPSKEEWALKINGKVWSKDGKTVTFASKEQALKARQSLLAKRPELEVGLVSRSVSEEKLNELSNEKLGQYKTAAALDAGKADSEGNHKRGNKRFSGIVKATKKQFANDTKKSSISQGINELEGDIETFTAPSTNKPPSHGFAIKVHGPFGSRQGGIAAATLWYALSAVFPKRYPSRDYQNYGAQLDSPQARVLNQIHRAGNAVVADGIAGRDLAETLANKLATFKPDEQYLNPIGTNHVEVIEQGMDEATEQSIDPFKHVNPRVNNPKILGTQNRAKSAYYPPSKPPVKKLDKPLPESLGDELTSKSIQALQQVKQQLEQQRMADLEQWEKDFKQNTVSKFTAREPNLRQRATSTPMVAMPGEKHSDLKARLSQLDKAIEKQGILDKLVQKLDKKGLLTPNIEAGVDTSMLVRDGARDNYVELNRKLDKALEYVKNRLLTNKAAYAKPKAIDEDDGAPTRMRMNDYMDLADAIQEKLRHAIQMGDKARIQELNKQRDELDARVKKHGMMPENVDEADMNRRGFLGNMGKAAGAGALAAAGLGGASNAQAFKGTLPAPAPSISKDEAEAQLEELRSKTYKELASMVWGVWPRILDTTFGVLTSADKPATPEQIGKMLGYRLAEYAEEYRQKVRAIKVAAGVKDPQSLNKTTGPVYVNEQDIDEEKQRLDPKCWKGYKKQGTKMKGDTRVNNCVPVKETKSHILAGLQQIDEGWKDKLGAAAIAGSMALGAAGANADTRRVTPDGQGNFTGGMKPTATVQAEPAPSTPSTATIPGQGLVRAERADRQAGTVTVDGQEYKMIMLEPGGIRPRGGQQIVIPQAVMGERGMGNYMAILAGGRVFVLPRNE